MQKIDDVWVRGRLRWWRDMRASKVDFVEFDQVARWGLSEHARLQARVAELEEQLRDALKTDPNLTQDDIVSGGNT